MTPTRNRVRFEWAAHPARARTKGREVSTTTPPIGTRVRFRRDWHVCVDFELTVPAGTVGTVTAVEIDELGGIAVRLDHHEPLLNDWDNEVQVYDVFGDGPFSAADWLEPVTAPCPTCGVDVTALRRELRDALTWAAPSDVLDARIAELDRLLGDA